jgi:hypothetical protein
MLEKGNIPGAAKVASPSDLTSEQEAILSEVYGYSDTAHYTEEDIELAKVMFDTPEKFALLRKILQVLTPEERGITIPGEVHFVDAKPEDRERFAFAVAVDYRADEKIRGTLVSFYQLLKGQFKKDKKEEFEKQNQEEFDEKKRSEVHEEKVEEDQRTVGTNL